MKLKIKSSDLFCQNILFLPPPPLPYCGTFLFCAYFTLNGLYVYSNLLFRFNRNKMSLSLIHEHEQKYSRLLKTDPCYKFCICITHIFINFICITTKETAIYCKINGVRPCFSVWPYLSFTFIKKDNNHKFLFILFIYQNIIILFLFILVNIRCIRKSTYLWSY